VTRRLHHCRDLGEHEPFDFLTWFEFAELRASEEWKYVDREVVIRLARA
jgi:hypothetical protein